MNRYKALDVLMGERKVGKLAISSNYLVAFEYDDEWLETGFSISPFSLPLEKGVLLPKGYDPFEGLFGVFADSLPDGWGRLLVDRLLLREKLNPQEVGSLQRLAIVAASGAGALTYFPHCELPVQPKAISLDETARECEKLFSTNTSDNLDELFCLGGSSGGARPKINYEWEGSEWIVKFPSSMDVDNIGEQEYAYSECAMKCGIVVPKTHLFESKCCNGYFASKRFDRGDEGRRHMISVSGILETSHRLPNLDYNILMKLTMQLTRDFEEIKQLYRRMCFNVFAHNRDDHAKNFSFLYDEENQRWMLSPAYDMTYSYSIGGEHATAINGNGKNPGMSEILAVAKNAKLEGKWAKVAALEIKEIVESDLKRYIK